MFSKFLKVNGKEEQETVSYLKGTVAKTLGSASRL